MALYPIGDQFTEDHTYEIYATFPNLGINQTNNFLVCRMTYETTETPFLDWKSSCGDNDLSEVEPGRVQGNKVCNLQWSYMDHIGFFKDFNYENKNVAVCAFERPIVNTLDP